VRGYGPTGQSMTAQSIRHVIRCQRNRLAVPDWSPESVTVKALMGSLNDGTRPVADLAAECAVNGMSVVWQSPDAAEYRQVRQGRSLTLPTPEGAQQGDVTVGWTTGLGERRWTHTNRYGVADTEATRRKRVASAEQAREGRAAKRRTAMLAALEQGRVERASALVADRLAGNDT
jgi:hypothetical protein